MNKKKISIDEFKQIELNILKYIKQICEEEGLRYFLGYGTLLGAIRHQGFIPWDDDIDICMPRADYFKFLNVLKNKNNSFYLGLECTECADYYYDFAKVVDTRTSVLENRMSKIENLGVWVDVFPIDGVPERYGRHIRKINLIRGLIVLASYKKVPLRRNKWSYVWVFPSWFLCRIFGFHYWIIKLNRLVQKNEYEKSKYVGHASSESGIRDVFDKKMFEEVKKVKFEDEWFNAPLRYDEYLKSMYGDYMKLPPIELQVGHHAFEAFWK